jgi:hypothetical protein
VRHPVLVILAVQCVSLVVGASLGERVGSYWLAALFALLCDLLLCLLLAAARAGADHRRAR